MAERKTSDRKGADRKVDRKVPPAKKPTNAPPSGRGLRTGAESLTFVAIAAVVLVLANVAGHYLLGGMGRIDLTRERRYSLSDGSRNLVHNLQDNMEVIVYFTSDLPPPFNDTEHYVREMLEEYEAASGGKLHVRYVDPDTDDEKEEAEQNGVHEVQHQVIENDSVSVRSGFRGLVIRYLGERKTIGVIQDTQGLEYEITSAIQQLVREPLPIGVLSGHDGPTPTKGLNTLRAALPHYELREVSATSEIDHELRALLVVGPETRLSEVELRRINQYVMRGGSLGVFGGMEKINLEGMQPAAQTADSGINDLLSHWGIRIGSNIVADARCGRVPMRTSIGIPIPVAYPPAPIIVFDPEVQRSQDYPVLFRLNQAPFFFTSAITTDTTFNNLHGMVLARSSAEASWLLTGDNIELQPRDPREWSMTGQGGPHAVLVALKGRLPSAFRGGMSSGDAPQIEAPDAAEHEVRVLVAGTGSLLRDEFLPNEEQRQGQLTAGLSLVLNAIDWLAQDADLIAIRAKNIEDPALDVPLPVQQAETSARTAAEQGDDAAMRRALEQRTAAISAWDNKKLAYRISLIAGLPLLVAVFGLVRWQFRRNKRASLEGLRSKLVRDSARRRAEGSGRGLSVARGRAMKKG